MAFPPPNIMTQTGAAQGGLMGGASSAPMGGPAGGFNMAGLQGAMGPLAGLMGGGQQQPKAKPPIPGPMVNPFMFNRIPLRSFMTPIGALTGLGRR